MKFTNMASLTCTCFLIVLLFMNGFADTATRVFKVGGELGWQEPGGNTSDVYNQWAQKNRFRVGDSLLFTYKNDSVIQVEKWGYFHCSSINPIIAFNNGRSIFNLDKSGPYYFISGALSHCKNGQRLIIEVMGIHHHGSHDSPPSIATPPDQSLQAPTTQPSSGTPFSISFSSVSIATLVALVWSY